MNEPASLLQKATEVLETNQRGDFTIPAEGLYPHQWLWDSCFIAIGLRHIDVDRAQKEILSLLRGQWANGMLPHMIFAEGDENRLDRNIWRSWINPYAPDHLSTSGITQPPMLAEAVRKIGDKLKAPERRTWYQTVWPALISYHQWLYTDRDPHKEGLVLNIHPYETGLDDTPPWIVELYEHSRPWWAVAMEKTHLDKAIDLWRRDIRHVPPGQRMRNIDALLYYSGIRRLRRKAYDIERVLPHALFVIEDLTFNSILLRANHHLRQIAKTIDCEIPEELNERMQKGKKALEQLWDAYSGQYFSRNFVTHKLIKEPSIATLMPLYAGTVTKERAEQLVALLKDKKLFTAKYPVPSVPLNSPFFKELGYWQGPTWINTNWLIIDGLERYGYKEEAALLAERTLEVVELSGFYEYFSPKTGAPGGAANFSWTAALAIDLLNRK